MKGLLKGMVIKNMIITCGVLLLTYNTYAQKVKHVFIISLDGSRPEFYMDTSWSAPNLRKLKDEGVYAAHGIKSVFPSLTYPSHTSIITGANPAIHGIYYNHPFEGRPGKNYWYTDAIKSRTLWKAVRNAGLTSASLFWDLSLGGPIDYNIPIRRPMEGEKGDFLTIRLPYIKPRDLLSDFQKETGENIKSSDLHLGAHYQQSKAITKISKFIINKYKPNFFTIHITAIDHQEHLHGTNSRQTKNAVKVVDSLVGEIIKSIKKAGIWKETALIIMGDHGHTNTKAYFSPNVYLKKHGLINADTWDNTIADGTWKAKFYSAGGSTFLYLKDQNNQLILDSVISILRSTPEFKKGYFRILDRTVLDKMGANPNTPIALAMKEGIRVSNKVQGKTFKKLHPPYKSTHGYDPNYQSMNTMFIIVGAGVAEHKDISDMRIVDIAPIVAKLLGLDFEAPDGVLLPGIIKKVD